MEIWRMRRRTQVCAENVMARSGEVLQRLTAAGELIEVVTCLDECRRCRLDCFALVSGVLEYARSPEELGRKLLARPFRGR